MFFWNAFTDFVKNLPVHFLKLQVDILIFICTINLFVSFIDFTLRTDNSIFLF